MHFSGWIIGAALAAGVGVSSSGVDSGISYVKQIETLRQERVARLTAPKGWLTLVGLDWLKDGKNSVGSAADNVIVIVKSVVAKPKRMSTNVLPLHAGNNRSSIPILPCPFGLASATRE